MDGSEVNARRILLDRIEVLDADLREAKARMQSVTLPKSIQKRLGSELFDAVDDLRGKVGKARDKVEALPENAAADDAMAQLRMKNAWAGFDGLEVAVGRQLTEVLALVSGARSRSLSAQHASLAEIADKLMDELSSKLQAIAWKRFTFEAEGEAFAGNTQIIRLRFPMKDIWNLPVAVHEFGHFLASQIRVPKEATRLANVLGPGDDVEKDKSWYYPNEFFADAVAAYAIGPAYGFTCLLTRFNPVNAWVEMDSFHPPDGERAELVLRILDRMDQEADSKGTFAASIKRLREFWTASLAAAGKPLTARDDRSKEIDALVDESYDLILKPGARHLRYNTSVKQVGGLQNLLSEGSAAIPQSVELTGLLNAAWRERLRPDLEGAGDVVNQQFLALWGRMSGAQVE